MVESLTEPPFEGSIHSIRAADLKAVIEIERSCFYDPWPENWFQAIIRCRDYFPGFFDQNGHLVGYAIAVPEGDQLHLANLAVHPDHCRRGIGTALVKETIDFSLSKNLIAVYLEVRKSNDSAIRLYLSLGFINDHVEESYYSDGEDALVLVRSNHGVV
jgi:ribosomal-protein-alanine N-acetyltransferase